MERLKNFLSEITGADQEAIKLAQEVGLQVCSGGIWGLGESEEDRIKMAFELQKLGVFSIPINILMPIPGTPLENNKPLEPREILKMIAIYRFILLQSKFSICLLNV